MNIADFRSRQRGSLLGFDFSDAEIKEAMRRVRARELPLLDKYVLAQLKLSYMGNIIAKEDKP